MAETFTTYAEHPDTGVEHEVIVTYDFTPPRAATMYDPPEGGVEIEDVTCVFELTEHQRDNAEQECIDHVFECYNERGYDA